VFKEIYLDLDGVLADFFSEWKNITGEGWLQGDTYWYAKKELLIIEKKDS
jgi:hypothetical protein